MLRNQLNDAIRSAHANVSSPLPQDFDLIQVSCPVAVTQLSPRMAGWPQQ